MLLLFSSLAFAKEATVSARVELTREGVHGKGLQSGNVVFWLSPVGIPASSLPALTPNMANPRLTQHNKSFQPHLLVVPVGSEVEFPNRDPFFHNVFSLFEGKRFDLGLYESGTTRFVQFDKPGVSYIFCNIHAQMSAVIIALNTPYYAISNVRGEISIPNVPPGRYELQVFHTSVPPENLRTITREITVAPGDTSLGTLTLTESNLEAHKNKYGRDYDNPNPDNPAYSRP
jgi:plastocyanin